MLPCKPTNNNALFFLAPAYYSQRIRRKNPTASVAIAHLRRSHLTQTPRARASPRITLSSPSLAPRPPLEPSLEWAHTYRSRGARTVTHAPLTRRQANLRSLAPRGLVLYIHTGKSGCVCRRGVFKPAVNQTARSAACFFSYSRLSFFFRFRVRRARPNPEGGFREPNCVPEFSGVDD